MGDRIFKAMWLKGDIDGFQEVFCRRLETSRSPDFREVGKFLVYCCQNIVVVLSVTVAHVRVVVLNIIGEGLTGTRFFKVIYMLNSYPNHACRSKSQSQPLFSGYCLVRK